MQNEDYSLQLTVLKSGNAHLKSLCKRLQKSLAEVSKLQDLFEINEEKIQNYSLILRNLSNYIQKIETKKNINYQDKIKVLLEEVQSLEQAVNDFSQEALQDPRKTIPYMRTATPNRPQVMKSTINPY